MGNRRDFVSLRAAALHHIHIPHRRRSPLVPRYYLHVLKRVGNAPGFQTLDPESDHIDLLSIIGQDECFILALFHDV